MDNRLARTIIALYTANRVRSDPDIFEQLISNNETYFPNKVDRQHYQKKSTETTTRTNIKIPKFMELNK